MQKTTNETAKAARERRELRKHLLEKVLPKGVLPNKKNLPKNIFVRNVINPEIEKIKMLGLPRGINNEILRQLKKT